MDSPTSKSRNKVLILIVGLLIVAVVAAYGVISSGVLEEKIDAEMEITAQIESDNLAYQQQRQRVPIQVAVRVNPAQAQSLITIAARAASGTSRSMILPMNTVMIWGCPQKK